MCLICGAELVEHYLVLIAIIDDIFCCAGDRGAPTLAAGSPLLPLPPLRRHRWSAPGIACACGGGGAAPRFGSSTRRRLPPGSSLPLLPRPRLLDSPTPATDLCWMRSAAEFGTPVLCSSSPCSIFYFGADGDVGLMQSLVNIYVYTYSLVLFNCYTFALLVFNFLG